ncbi:MAG TPA: hypothetical protein VFC10_00360 [Terriglobia bacterium]|nr:hypothetical protein [Terriglobia bacterium]
MIVRRVWEGKQWQKYIEDLLVLHYGPEDFQRVPDEYQGDLGIEAFTRSGVGVQCYAPQGHLNIKQRYEKHRDKMSADIGKLIANGNGLKAVLGQTILKRWLFIIPDHDNKQLIEFANKKACEVREKSLPYICPDFEIQVHDDGAFPAARAKLLGVTDVQLQLDVPEAGVTQVQDWASENDSLVRTIDGKLARVSTLKSKERRQEFRNLLVARAIEGQNILEQVRKISPDLYERVIELKAARAVTLQMESYMSTVDPADRLTSVVADYVATLHAQVKVLPMGAENVLGYEAVCDWLALCNLDFPEVGHA